MTYVRRCLAALVWIGSTALANETGDWSELNHWQDTLDSSQQSHIVVYGDMRFTDTTEHEASVPGARRALVAAIADENPAAVFLTGDIPWHGGNLADYAVFKQETQAWQERHIAVWPVLGNHEFQQCAESVCLENWWQTFPRLRGKRYYSVDVAPSLTVVALDSNDSLLDGSVQRRWLTDTLQHVRASTRFVLLLLHHPPVADVASGALASHNARPNEAALAQAIAAATQAYPSLRFVVIAGHIHNYEHLERNGVVYLVSGGGGAKPYPVERSADDLYLGPEALNFHYLNVTVLSARLRIEMRRLTDPLTPQAHWFSVADQIEIPAASQNP
jgi:acid phosphatase type 7